MTEIEKTNPDKAEKIDGHPNLQRGGPGRKAGLPNKATSAAREAIARFVDGNAERLTGWLDEIAEDNPEKAFHCFMSVVEYHIPKLARTEQTGLDGGPIETKTSLSDSDHDILNRYFNQNHKEPKNE